MISGLSSFDKSVLPLKSKKSEIELKLSVKDFTLVIKNKNKTNVKYSLLQSSY